ncbi:hypothetical protein Syun_019930 [Stephania yunnanensis]|uniref:Uncharacterized protein n=1 Tax=Stephania yunnanensis TaxID=152371 RepID=A0AAP0IWQ8_9MAGN
MGGWVVSPTPEVGIPCSLSAAPLGSSRNDSNFYRDFIIVILCNGNVRLNLKDFKSLHCFAPIILHRCNNILLNITQCINVHIHL